MMKTGILKLHPNSDGNTEVILNTNKDFSLHFNSRDIPQSELAAGELKVPIEIYLFGDLKYIFMMMGRDAYSGHHCLFCCTKKAEWKKMYRELSSARLNNAKWTIPLLEQVMYNIYKYLPDGKKLNHIWNFIPVTLIIIPILHILLGLTNDVLANF